MTRDPLDLGPEQDVYRLLIDSVQDHAILLLDAHGVIKSWNKGAELIKGYIGSEVIGLGFDIFFTEEDNNNGLPQIILKAAAEKGSVHDIGWRMRKDGSRFWADVMISPLYDRDKQLIGFSKVTHDLTEQKKAEEERRKVDEILEICSHSARIGAWEYDVIDDTLTWSGVSRQLREVPDDYQPDLTKAMSFFKEGEHRDRIQNSINEAIATGKPYIAEVIVVTATGREVWCRSTSQAEFIDGRCARVFGILQDIDEQKRTQLKLQFREEQFRNTFEMSGTGMALVSPQLMPILVNKKICDILGYTKEELYSKQVAEITHPDDLAADRDHARRMLDGEMEQYHLTKRYIHKNGSIVWANITVTLVRDAQGQPVHAISEIEDITEQKINLAEKKKIEEILQTTNETARIGAWEVDLITNKITWSKVTRDLHEVDDDYEPTFETASKFHLPGEGLNVIRNAFNNAVQFGTPFDLELILVTARGREIWCR